MNVSCPNPAFTTEFFLPSSSQSRLPVRPMPQSAYHNFPVSAMWAGNAPRCFRQKKKPPGSGFFCGVPEGIRTPGLPLRRRSLYPTELQRQILQLFPLQATNIVYPIAGGIASTDVPLHLLCLFKYHFTFRYISVTNISLQCAIKSIIIKKG